MDAEGGASDFEPVEALGVHPLIAALVSHEVVPDITDFDTKLSLDHVVDLTNILLAKLENERRAAEAAKT